MGYQESFVTTTNKKNFDAFIDRIKTLGKDYYAYFDCCPCLIVTVKQNIQGMYEKKIMLKQNKKYIYFTGERYLQRSQNRIINLNDPFDTDHQDNEDHIIKTQLASFFQVQIIFCEEVDCAKIFSSSKNNDGEIYAGLNNDFLEAAKFMF